LQNISFHKVHKDPIENSIEKDNIKFDFSLKKNNYQMVELKGQLLGNLAHYCDWCGRGVTILVDDEINLLLNDGIYSGNEESYDIIEIENSKIDIDSILDSEINLIKSDYHLCDECKNKQGE